MTNPVGRSNLIDAIKGVFLSFELIIVNIIINAVNHKYNDRLSWDNLEIHNSGFILNIYIYIYIYLNPKSVFYCTENFIRG